MINALLLLKAAISLLMFVSGNEVPYLLRDQAILLANQAIMVANSEIQKSKTLEVATTAPDAQNAPVVASIPESAPIPSPIPISSPSSPVTKPRWISEPKFNDKNVVTWEIADADAVGYRCWEQGKEKTNDNQIYSNNRQLNSFPLPIGIHGQGDIFQKGKSYICDFFLQKIDPPENLQNGKLTNLASTTVSLIITPK